jgi:hypothetical protein
MQPEEESLRSRIAIGWVMLLVLVVIMLDFMTMSSILANDNFKLLRMDPGPSGLVMLVWVLGLLALMPLYVHWVHPMRSRIPRWIAVVVAVLTFLYFLLHHLAHWAAGQRPDPTSHVFDVIFHLFGLWVIVNSIRWARFRRPDAA